MKGWDKESLRHSAAKKYGKAPPYRGKKKTIFKKGFDYGLRTIPNVYGFGRDYYLVLTIDGKKKEYWLGQAAKVFSRVLGMRMDDAVKYYSEKAGSDEFDKSQKYIAEDLIRTYVGKGETEPITKEDLKKIAKAQSWELHVGGG